MTTKSDTEFIPCYIARDKCGCAVSAIVDDPVLREAMAKDIAEFMTSSIQDGLTIDRVTVGWVRRNLGHKCGK